jgi:hypothetical protein
LVAAASIAYDALKHFFGYLALSPQMTGEPLDRHASLVNRAARSKFDHYHLAVIVLQRNHNNCLTGWNACNMPVQDKDGKCFDQN